MTGVDHDIGTGAENKIPKSITQSGKVQQVSKIFPVSKPPTPLLVYFSLQSRSQYSVAKGCSIGSSLRIKMTTTGKT